MHTSQHIFGILECMTGRIVYWWLRRGHDFYVLKCFDLLSVILQKNHIGELWNSMLKSRPWKTQKFACQTGTSGEKGGQLLCSTNKNYDVASFSSWFKSTCNPETSITRIKGSPTTISSFEGEGHLRWVQTSWATSICPHDNVPKFPPGGLNHNLNERSICLPHISSHEHVINIVHMCMWSFLFYVKNQQTPKMQTRFEATIQPQKCEP